MQLVGRWNHRRKALDRPGDYQKWGGDEHEWGKRLGAQYRTDRADWAASCERVAMAAVCRLMSPINSLLTIA